MSKFWKHDTIPGMVAIAPILAIESYDIIYDKKIWVQRVPSKRLIELGFICINPPLSEWQNQHQIIQNENK